MACTFFSALMRHNNSPLRSSILRYIYIYGWFGVHGAQEPKTHRIHSSSVFFLSFLEWIQSLRPLGHYKFYADCSFETLICIFRSRIHSFHSRLFYFSFFFLFSFLFLECNAHCAVLSRSVFSASPSLIAIRMSENHPCPTENIPRIQIERNQMKKICKCIINEFKCCIIILFNFFGRWSPTP